MEKEDWRFAPEGRQEEKAEFLRFMRRMLAWVPEERASASELLDDPFLKVTAEDLKERDGG